MKIKLNSVVVDDQDKAEAFYTDILGFRKKQDIAMGEHRWLTVVSPDAPDEAELLLEPLGFAPAATFQKELLTAGIPFTAFEVSDVRAEYKKLLGKGVEFKGEPMDVGTTIIAMFYDTCGNLIQIYQA